jgi:hypothetical protein
MRSFIHLLVAALGGVTLAACVAPVAAPVDDSADAPSAFSDVAPETTKPELLFRRQVPLDAEGSRIAAVAGRKRGKGFVVVWRNGDPQPLTTVTSHDIDGSERWRFAFRARAEESAARAAVTAKGLVLVHTWKTLYAVRADGSGLAWAAKVDAHGAALAVDDSAGVAFAGALADLRKVDLATGRVTPVKTEAARFALSLAALPGRRLAALTFGKVCVVEHTGRLERPCAELPFAGLADRAMNHLAYSSTDDSIVVTGATVITGRPSLTRNVFAKFRAADLGKIFVRDRAAPTPDSNVFVSPVVLRDGRIVLGGYVASTGSAGSESTRVEFFSADGRRVHVGDGPDRIVGYGTPVATDGVRIYRVGIGDSTLEGWRP